MRRVCCTSRRARASKEESHRAEEADEVERCEAVRRERLPVDERKPYVVAAECFPGRGWPMRADERERAQRGGRARGPGAPGAGRRRISARTHVLAPRRDAPASTTPAGQPPRPPRRTTQLVRGSASFGSSRGSTHREAGAPRPPTCRARAAGTPLDEERPKQARTRGGLARASSAFPLRGKRHLLRGRSGELHHQASLPVVVLAEEVDDVVTRPTAPVRAATRGVTGRPKAAFFPGVPPPSCCEHGQPSDETGRSGVALDSALPAPERTRACPANPAPSHAPRAT